MGGARNPQDSFPYTTPPPQNTRGGSRPDGGGGGGAGGDRSPEDLDPSGQSSSRAGWLHRRGAGARKGSERPGASPACKQKGMAQEAGAGAVGGHAGGQHPEPRSPGSSRRATRRSGRTGETEAGGRTGEVESGGRPRPRPASGRGRRPCCAHAPAPGCQAACAGEYREAQGARRGAAEEPRGQSGRLGTRNVRPQPPPVRHRARPRTAGALPPPGSRVPHRGAPAELRRPSGPASGTRLACFLCPAPREQQHRCLHSRRRAAPRSSENAKAQLGRLRSRGGVQEGRGAGHSASSRLGGPAVRARKTIGGRRCGAGLVGGSGGSGRWHWWTARQDRLPSRGGAGGAGKRGAPGRQWEVAGREAGAHWARWRTQAEKEKKQ